MVFDTSLLAAFDAPGVDPAAQQQAANLLSQPSYQPPQSISPPSFTGGAGLSEPRPQTVTQGAPYYDPIAIHSGNAPVNYVGPTVDYSQYTNLFGPTTGPNQITPPSMAGSSGLYDDPSAAFQERYRDLFNQDLSGQGFVQSPEGWIPPPGYTGSRADFDEGVRRAQERVMGQLQPSLNIFEQQAAAADASRGIELENYLADEGRRQYEDYLRRYSIGDLDFAPEGAPTPVWGQDYVDAPTGTLRAWLEAQRAGQSQYGGIPGAAARAAVDVYNTDIPIWSDLARNVIKPAAETIGNLAPGFHGYNALADALPYLPSTGQVASASVPVTLGDVGLEAIPGVGFAPDALRAAQRLAPDISDVIRRGGANLDQLTARLGPGELGAARIPGGTPDPNKMTPDAINAISRRTKGGGEKPIFEGIQQAADAPPASSYIPGTEAYARGKSSPDLPDYGDDPGYWESLAKQVDTGGNPARTKTVPQPVRRTVTQGDGTAVDATDEAIKAAVDRFTRRPTSAKLIKTDPVADPEGFLDELAEQVVKAKTRGGRPLMAGVTKEEVKQSLVNISNKLDDVLGPTAATPAAPTPIRPSSATPPTTPAASQGSAPPPTGTTAPALPSDLQRDLDHFTKMTRGVIENNSLLQKAYDATRIATRWASGDVADSRIAELIAREAELRTYLAQHKLPAANLNRIVRNWRMQELARHFSGPDLKKAADFMRQNARTRSSRDFTDEISDTLKATALNMDFAVAGQQVEAGLRRGSVPIATGIIRDAANRIATKLHMPGAMEVYLRNDIDHVRQAIADGVQMGGGETANISARGRSLFGRIPKIGGPIEAGLDKLADLQYGAVLGTVRLRAYEGLLLQNKVIHDLTFGKLGGDITDPLVRRHIAEQANMIGSTSREATQAIRSRVENKLLLTSRMTRAQVNEIVTPLKTLRSQEDVINTMNLLGSIAVYMGAAKVANDQFGIGDFVWDPLEQGFGQIKTNVEDKTGRKQIIDFLPQDALSTAIIRSINAWKDDDWDRFRDSWLRLGAGRLNMLPSNILKFTGYGYDSKGRFHGPDDERMSLKEAAKGAAPVPITVRDIASDQSAFNVATAITGQGNFPENETQVKERIAQEKYGKSYNELFNTEKDEVDKDAAVQAAEAFSGPTPLDLVGQQKETDRSIASTGQVPEGAVDWLKNSGLKSAAEIDQLLASGQMTGAEARAAYQALREELVRRDMQNRESPEVLAQLAEIEKAVAEKGEQSLSPAEKAQRDYYAILDQANASGTFDFDLYNQKLDEWVAQYGDQRDLISASRAPLSPGEAELKDLRTQLDAVQWFESYDTGYQALLRNNPQFATKFAQYPDYESFESGMKQRITESLRRQYGTQYIDQDKINDIYFDILTGEGIMQAVNVVEAVTLFRHPELIPQLQKWYDLDEGEMKILEEIRRTNGSTSR